MLPSFEPLQVLGKSSEVRSIDSWNCIPSTPTIHVAARAPPTPRPMEPSSYCQEMVGAVYTMGWQRRVLCHVKIRGRDQTTVLHSPPLFLDLSVTLSSFVLYCLSLFFFFLFFFFSLVGSTTHRPWPPVYPLLDKMLQSVSHSWGVRVVAPVSVVLAAATTVTICVCLNSPVTSSLNLKTVGDPVTAA